MKRADPILLEKALLLFELKVFVKPLNKDPVMFITMAPSQYGIIQ